MNVQLERKNTAYHFEAINESGQIANMDTNPSSGI